MIPLPGTVQRERKRVLKKTLIKYIHHFIYYNPKLQTHVSRRMKNQIVVYPSMKYISALRKINTHACNNVDEPQKH